MADAELDALGVAIFATIHIPEGTSITITRRPDEGIYLLAFGTERFELELDEGMIPTLATALATLSKAIKPAAAEKPTGNHPHPSAKSPTTLTG